MQKIGDSTSTANGAGEFTQGQPGSGVDATIIAVTWLNAVQRELIHVVEGAGINLDPADDSQVLKAIQAIQTAANTWVKLSGKPTTLSGFGITDAFTKTETTTTVQQAVAALVASSPAALDTLKELADALGNDPNFATTITTALAGKAAKASTLVGYGITDAYTAAQVDAKTALATEANQGTAKVASQALVNAGVDDSAFVTAKKLRWNFAASMAANGYLVFPSWLGGFVLQWGVIPETTKASEADFPLVSFPIAFPNAALFAAGQVTNLNGTAGSGDSWCVLKSLFTSGAQFFGSSNISITHTYGLRWFAFGY